MSGRVQKENKGGKESGVKFIRPVSVVGGRRGSLEESSMSHFSLQRSRSQLSLKNSLSGKGNNLVRPATAREMVCRERTHFTT